MKPIKTFLVKPHLPGELTKLKDLAENLRWSWNPPLEALFANLNSSDSWHGTGQNPILQLGLMGRERIEELAKDEAFLYNLRRHRETLENYVTNKNTWYGNHADAIKTGRLLTAYFSMEFGLADCLPIFSGGLGILAGDHMKSSSEMGVPLVGIGLLYQRGYFRQYLSPDGWQQESRPNNDFFNMPMERVEDAAGVPLTVEVPLPARRLRIFVWRVKVGRNELYLLDANHPENSPEDRAITNDLYGGGQETRIQQEMVLGIGGVRVLGALGFDPLIYHINEGHAAFLTLERIREVRDRFKVDFRTAADVVRNQLVFTTHTPVPAGIDVFPKELVEHYFRDYSKDLGVSFDELFRLGKETPESQGFNMAVLAINMSRFVNGVAKLHGKVSRSMWAGLWQGMDQEDVPIGSVTNGVHLPTWISPEMSHLLDRYLGPAWKESSNERRYWDLVEKIPADELWRTHERCRERLVTFARRSYADQLRKQGASPSRVRAAEDILDPDALTIGFARRFAPYKRATLILNDIDRLLRILGNRKRPVQFIFAGKAHPADNLGKELVRSIVQFSHRPEVAGRFVFLEDYDMEVARYLVQGVDVWLNNPRPPLEASGTSGMKAVANGALHFSTRDGWWAEVNGEGLGWTIGRGEEYPASQQNYQDEVEARDLYDILEKEIIPLYYDRNTDDIPRGWADMMKQSMRLLCPYFNSNRMVREYTSDYYLKAAQRFATLEADGLAAGREYSLWRRKLERTWGSLRVQDIKVEAPELLAVGDRVQIQATLELGEAAASDLLVEILLGGVGLDYHIGSNSVVPMVCTQTTGTQGVFTAQVPMDHAGRIGFALRILARAPGSETPEILPGLVKIVENGGF